ncbi:Fic/DOC family N-terminal domain-containing protein [Tychonema sp. LEGE 07203]|uniref:Fic/DOC family N-terminal domain-containing protein n=1 Tax=Tychonema sp. LEGE 07203 TaxID=1828671 RepID=UPI001D133B4E|nr:Fic/DOC family N-terminal domain-containing protein [Tychonema sp. LEGE 07203]
MMRSGRYVQQIEGYSAFIPAPLPPKPPIKMDGALNRLLSDADRALGRLDGATCILPNPDLFVAMYVRQEAVLSSQIEGTQSTLEDVLQYEIDVKGQERFKDVQEVVNYVNAMNYGLKRLQEFPLCLRTSLRNSCRIAQRRARKRSHARRISEKSKLDWSSRM